MTLCLAVHACDRGTGGAVELSWSLRPASSPLRNEPFVGCEGAVGSGWGPIAKIRLSWHVGDIDGSDEWNCDDNHGATGFDVPVGVADLSVAPLCTRDELPAQDSYIAPALVQRNVIRGEIVSLNAVEIVVTVDQCSTASGSAKGDMDCICGTSQATN